MTNVGTSNKSVLIIADDKLELELLAIVFEELGFQDIDCFRDPYGALEKIQTNVDCVDLLVIDLQMPDFDGAQLLSELVTIHFAGYVLLMSEIGARTPLPIEKMAMKKLCVLGAIEKPLTPAKLKPLLVKANNDIEGPFEKEEYQINLEDIEQALINNEFIPYFQPKVEINSNKVVSFEALARWQAPNGEVICPLRFVPLAEETDSIFNIDMMIFEKTCRFMVDWQVKGLGFTGSINLSAKSLARRNASKTIQNITQRYGLQLGQFVFELTESVLADEADAAMENILRLHLYGAHLAMDDFGRGYSGMQHLHQIPFTELKIDQSFVTGASLDTSKRAIIKSSVELAEKFHLQTICEGVESQEDLAVVKAAGAKLGQGYYFSKPLPEEDFLLWAENYSQSLTQHQATN